MSVHRPFIRPSVNSLICLSVHQSFIGWFVHRSTCWYVGMLVRRSVGPILRFVVELTRQSIYRCIKINPSILSIYWSICLSIPSVQQTGYPSVRPSVHPSVRPSVHPSVRPSVRPSIRPFAHYLLANLSI